MFLDDDDFRFIHERMFKGVWMIVLELFLVEVSRNSQLLIRKLSFRCFISCLEAKDDSSVISIRVEREREYKGTSCVFRIRLGKIMFLIFLIFGGGVEE